MIPIAMPVLEKNEAEAAGRVVLSGWVSQGRQVTFEQGLPFEPEWARSNWQSYCVRLPERVDQKQVMQSLLDQGIATRRGIMCSHREPA